MRKDELIKALLRTQNASAKRQAVAGVAKSANGVQASKVATAKPVGKSKSAPHSPVTAKANGAKANGAKTNGAKTNGAKTNGAKPISVKTNGAKANGAQPSRCH